MEKEDFEKNNEKLSARATNAERTDQTETAEANLEVNRKRRGCQWNHNPKHTGRVILRSPS